MRLNKVPKIRVRFSFQNFADALAKCKDLSHTLTHEPMIICNYDLHGYPIQILI